MIRSWDGGRTWRHRWAEEFAEGFFGVGTRVVHPLFSNTSLEVGFPYRQQTLVVRSTLYPHSSPYPIRLALILSTTSSILPSRYFLFNGVDAVIYRRSLGRLRRWVWVFGGGGVGLNAVVCEEVMEVLKGK